MDQSRYEDVAIYLHLMVHVNKDSWGPIHKSLASERNGMAPISSSICTLIQECVSKPDRSLCFCKRLELTCENLHSSPATQDPVL